VLKELRSSIGEFIVMTPKIIPIGQSSVKVCCGDEACVVIEVGEHQNPDPNLSAPDEPDYHGGDYIPPGSGILPYFAAGRGASGFFASVDSWEALAEVVRGGEAAWRVLERSSSSRVIFIVHAGNIVDIHRLRDVLGGIPADLEVIVGVAPN
jgi:hypothetical protein